MAELEHTSLERQAQLYALLHSGNPGDVEYYARCCAGAHVALELGVGYGRIAAHLAAQGVRVIGLDNHPGLLRMAEERAHESPLKRRFETQLGDMRSFRLECRFDRILIPYSGLYCLLDDAEVEACLDCCRAHLNPGGLLVFDVYECDDFHTECDPQDVAESEREPVVEVSHHSQRLMVYEHSSWDKPTQRLDVHYEYFDQNGMLVHTASVRQRYLLRQQILAKLGASGFGRVQVAGGFNGEPVSPLSDAVVFEAQAT